MFWKCVAAAAAVGLTATASHASLVSVSGPSSSGGVAAAIIGAPSDALDDAVTNRSMEGFDEAQGVVTSVAHAIDGGGSIAAGTLVDSHMIFLNSAGTAALSHFSVDWTFGGAIIGIMSDSGGTREANSTFELGAAGTNYTVVSGTSGPAAPFPARGMEGNDGTGAGPFPNDGYMLMAPNVLRVGMSVTEPGDWIRVVTVSDIPVPATLPLIGTALIGLGWLGRRRRRS